MCVPCVAAAAIRGRGLVEEILHHHYGRLLLLPQLILSTKNLTSRKVKAKNSAFLFDQKVFAFESIAAHDLI